VSRYQKGKTDLDFTEARDSEWQWNQLDHMQVCTSLQTDNYTSTPQLCFFTGRMPFLPPNQQRQSTEGNTLHHLQCQSVKALWAKQCVNIPRQAANLMIRLNLSQLTVQVALLAQINMKQ